MINIILRKIFDGNLDEEAISTNEIFLKRKLSLKFWMKATWIINYAMKTVWRNNCSEIQKESCQWCSCSSVKFCFRKFYHQLFFRKRRIAVFQFETSTTYFCNDAFLGQFLHHLFLKVALWKVTFSENWTPSFLLPYNRSDW